MLTPIWNFHLYASYDCTMDYELSENGIINIYYIDLINRMPITWVNIVKKEWFCNNKKFYKKTASKATESIAIVTDLKPEY